MTSPADRAAPDSQLGRIRAYAAGRLSDHTVRDRIAGALYERERVPGAPAWEHAYAADREVFEAMADAVLPVLPASRAAVLRWAADELGRMDYDTDSTDYGYDTYRDAWNGGVMDAAEKLRRMADEAQPTTAPKPGDHAHIADTPESSA